MTTTLIIVIILGLIFDFLNGFHDSSNIVATVISSRALKPRSALLLTAFGEFLGPLLFGVSVAETVGKGLLHPEVITLQVMLAALIGAILWNLATWFFGVPSSSSHALIGGLLGSAIIGNGVGVVQMSGLTKILISLLVSPPLGLMAGYIITKLIFSLSRLMHLTPRVNNWFRRFQMISNSHLVWPCTHPRNK
jgi:PiT family inorganic phosphate transporter